MIIEQVYHYSQELLEAIQTLMPQLTKYSSIPDAQQIKEIIAHQASSIWIVRNEVQHICGMLTLSIYPTPTGIHAWIEDVVVDENFRNQGFAAALTTAAVQYAKDNQAKSVSLTSRPARIAANQLYQKMGFQKIDTNLYRIDC